MELIKNNKIVIAVVLIVLVLVVIRSSGINHFKNDAKRLAGPTLEQSNTITREQASRFAGKNLIINMDKDYKSVNEITGEVQNITADSILCKKYVNTILKHNGSVLLSSSEPGLSARIWMILSQMGCTNIYILTTSTDNEVFKYKFRPDTLMH